MRRPRLPRQRRQRTAVGPQEHPDGREPDRRREDHVAERAVADAAAAADERRDRDECLPQDPAGECRPAVGPIE